jgi:hypothetical protein
MKNNSKATPKKNIKKKQLKKPKVVIQSICNTHEPEYRGEYTGVM